jgi:hypothetical protein
MDLESLTRFFMWCTILNVGMQIFFFVVMLTFKDTAYRMQKKFFPLTNEQLDLVMYCFLGGFKLLVTVFCIVPWIALLIIG